MKKKLMALLLAGTMILGLAACSRSVEQSDPAPAQNSGTPVESSAPGGA